MPNKPLRRPEREHRRPIGRGDMWVLLGITVALLVSVILLTLRLLDQSEKHVESVRNMKVRQTISDTWVPDTNDCDKQAKKDLEENPNRTEAQYRVELSEKAMFYIAQMHNLQHLILAGCSVEDEWLEKLERLPLTKLDLSDSDVTDKGMVHIAKLTNMGDLIVARCPGIGDEGIAKLSSLKNMTRLNISGTNLTDSGAKVLPAFSHLTFLSISNTKVTGASLAYVAELKELNTLEMDGIKVTPKDLTYLTKLRKLGYLHADNCGLTDDDLEVITHTPINFLNLSGNPISGAGLLKLVHDHKALASLTVQGCPHVSKADIAKINKVKPSLRLTYSTEEVNRIKQYREQYKDFEPALNLPKE